MEKNGKDRERTGRRRKGNAEGGEEGADGEKEKRNRNELKDVSQRYILLKYI